MMLIYRPHRGGLNESMALKKEFNNFNEMREYIANEWNSLVKDYNHIDIEDIVVEHVGDDDRIGWRNVHYVCAKRLGENTYKHPRCIGMCSWDYDTE